MILITGLPRSGTTPLGEIFGSFLDLSVLHEPYNYHTGFSHVMQYFQYRYGSTQDYIAIRAHMIRLGNRDVEFKSGVFPSDKIGKRLVKYVIGGRTERSYNGFVPQRGVVKDPFLSLVATTVSDLFSRVYITIRPPGGIISSYQRYNWIFPELLPSSSDLSPWLGEGIDVNQYSNAPVFYAIWLQVLFYQQLSAGPLPNNVSVVDSSKLPSRDNLYWQELVGDYVVDWDKFLRDLERMYTSPKQGLSKVHNHYQGKDLLAAKNQDVEIPSALTPLFDYVDSQYRFYSGR